MTPGDIFAGTGERNAYGTIGVILDLRSEQSLATATRGDGGSLWYGEGPRVFDEKNLTIEDLERSQGYSWCRRSDHPRDSRTPSPIISIDPIAIDVDIAERIVRTDLLELAEGDRLDSLGAG